MHRLESPTRHTTAAGVPNLPVGDARLGERGISRTAQTEAISISGFELLSFSFFIDASDSLLYLLLLNAFGDWMGTRIDPLPEYPIKRLKDHLYYLDGAGYVCSAPLARRTKKA
jgi:hypothetical protein